MKISLLNLHPIAFYYNYMYLKKQSALMTEPPWLRPYVLRLINTSNYHHHRLTDQQPIVLVHHMIKINQH